MGAITSEGKIQVELAQLRYRSARLVGLRESLSRLGGGIGTRGPGEKKLETDRRLIRTRISALKQELSQVEKHRELIRSSRARGNMKTAAIVGYTNAGKSTLLNTLTGSEVLSEDKLFATLDPTTRLLNLKDGQQILLTDTVGFIHKLPHHLVEAFKSTLEEAKYADYIIHVVDSSNPQAEMQMHVVYETLKELGVMGKKISGILTEMSAEIDYINHVVIGIGINVNMESFPEDIAKTATSLRIEAGKEFRRFELIATIMEHFEKAYEAVCEAGSLEPIMEDYNRLLVNCGRRVRVLEPEHEYDALALGIDKTGELQVECEDGSRKSVFAGEVSVRGIYGYV